MSRGATITATPTTPPKTASASEHAENSSKSVSSSYIAASNAQHDQRYKSHADEQRYERDEIVFEPMPITEKHDVWAPLAYNGRSSLPQADKMIAFVCADSDLPLCKTSSRWSDAEASLLLARKARRQSSTAELAFWRKDPSQLMFG